jgi:hypothetical protein
MSSKRKWDDRGTQQPPVLDHKKLAQDIAGRINLQLQQQQQILQKQRPVCILLLSYIKGFGLRKWTIYTRN